MKEPLLILFGIGLGWYMKHLRDKGRAAQAEAEANKCKCGGHKAANDGCRAA